MGEKEQFFAWLDEYEGDECEYCGGPVGIFTYTTKDDLPAKILVEEHIKGCPEYGVLEGEDE